MCFSSRRPAALFYKFIVPQNANFATVFLPAKPPGALPAPALFQRKAPGAGDSIEALAQKMNVPEDNLKQTIEKYRKAVETGVDEEFGRTNNLSIDFTNGPFYAVTTSPGLQVSLGGILVNDNMQVQRQDGTEFDNLYAVGECADDGLFGCAPTNINITFGKFAAEHILAK